MTLPRTINFLFDRIRNQPLPKYDPLRRQFTWPDGGVLNYEVYRLWCAELLSKAECIAINNKANDDGILHFQSMVEAVRRVFPIFGQIFFRCLTK